MRPALLPVILASVISSGSPAHAETRLSVAVFPLIAQRVPQDIVSVLDELVVTEVHAKSGYKTIGASDLNSMLGLDKMKSALGCDDVSCAAQIGGALGVDLLLSGTVGRLGKELIITLKLIDIQKSELKERISLRIPDDEAEYASGVDKAVRQLLHLEAATDSSPAQTTAAVSPERRVDLTPAAPPPAPAAPPAPSTEMRAPAQNGISVALATRTLSFKSARSTVALESLLVASGGGLAASRLLAADLDDPQFSFLGASVGYRREYLGHLATSLRALFGKSSFLVSAPAGEPRIEASGSSLGVGAYEELFFRLWESSAPMAGSNGGLDLFFEAGGEGLFIAPKQVPGAGLLGAGAGLRFLWLFAEFNAGYGLGQTSFNFQNVSWGQRGARLPASGDGSALTYKASGVNLGATVGATLQF
jgi:TolB-like protein